MAWEEITKSAGGTVRREAGAWYVGINSTGVRITLPDNCPLLEKRFVRVFFGKDEDEGWMLLAPSESGRVINRSPKKNGPAPYIAFTTLPGVTKEMRLRPERVPALAESADRWRVRLPWIRPETLALDVSDYNRSMKTTIPLPPEQGLPMFPVVRTVDKDGREVRAKDRVKIEKKPDKSIEIRREPAGTPVFSMDKGEELGPPVRSRPPRDATSTVIREREQAEIDAFIAKNGATRPWTLEQAAELIREKGRRVTIRVGKIGRQSGHTVWLEQPQPVLDGAEVTIEKLFEVVNGYRLALGQPPVQPHLPPPTEAPGIRMGTANAVEESAEAAA